MGKLPALMFYPNDWLADPVSGCSLAAQGLWLRLMMLMHSSERRGYLQLNGMPMHPEAAARRCGSTLGQYMTLLRELSAAGVPSSTADGILFNRRMVRDEKERQANANRQAVFRDKSKNKSIVFSKNASLVTGQITPQITTKYVNEDVIGSKKKKEEVPCGSDLWIEKILQAHPKADFSQACQSQVIDAIADESAHQGISETDAAEYLLVRTQLYAEKVMVWPDKTVSVSAINFFRGKHYRQDASMWEKPGTPKQVKFSPADSPSARKKRELEMP